MHRQMQNSSIYALNDEGGGPVWTRKWQSVLRNSFELLQGNTLDLAGDHASDRHFSREEHVKFSAFAARSGLIRTRNDWQHRRGVPDSVPGMQAIQDSYHPPVAGRGVHTCKQMLNLEMAHRHGIYVVAAWPLTTAEWDAMRDEERAARNAHAVLARRVREHELAEAVPVIAAVSEAIVSIDDDTRPTDWTDWLADASELPPTEDAIVVRHDDHDPAQEFFASYQREERPGFPLSPSLVMRLLEDEHRRNTFHVAATHWDTATGVLASDSCYPVDEHIPSGLPSDKPCSPFICETLRTSAYPIWALTTRLQGLVMKKYRADTWGCSTMDGSREMPNDSFSIFHTSWYHHVMYAILLTC